MVIKILYISLEIRTEETTKQLEDAFPSKYWSKFVLRRQKSLFHYSIFQWLDVEVRKLQHLNISLSKPSFLANTHKGSTRSGNRLQLTRYWKRRAFISGRTQVLSILFYWRVNHKHLEMLSIKTLNLVYKHNGEIN